MAAPRFFSRDQLDVQPVVVTWFPQHMHDLDICAHHALEVELDPSDPGLNDPAYCARRQVLRDLVVNYRHGQPLHHDDYNAMETQTWTTIYRTIRPLGVAIPQFAAISSFPESTTGFTLHPVMGYLSPRDFLNGLAFRVFFCTQYIRHHSVPFYTQEWATVAAAADFMLV
ncbi:hypothetical protein AC1031_013780 [Aphanomyces cochlioides]|nr:hypothetical protein AC1031_013780 [Aphanomyces cochlioides]